LPGPLGLRLKNVAGGTSLRAILKYGPLRFPSETSMKGAQSCELALHIRLI